MFDTQRNYLNPRTSDQNILLFILIYQYIAVISNCVLSVCPIIAFDIFASNYNRGRFQATLSSQASTPLYILDMWLDK